MSRRLRRLAVAALVGYAVVAAFLYLTQDRLMFSPRTYSSSELRYAEAHTQRIPYLVGQWKQTAFYFPPSKTKASPKTLWIIFGGNGSVALDFQWLAEQVVSGENGTAVLVVDYPGYGMSEGKPSHRTIVEGCSKAYAALVRKLGLAPKEVNVAAHSLGTGAALEFAARKKGMPIRRIVLASPYTSTVAVATHRVGWPLGLLLKHRFDNEARLREILKRKHPPRVTIIHGNRDWVIPFKMGKKLARANQSIEFVELDGVGHDIDGKILLKHMTHERRIDGENR